jgi:hypothetical protein
MAALVMVLMAGMAVPASGTEGVSAELKQNLDLSGEWEGTGQTRKWKLKVTCGDGVLRARPRCAGVEIPCVITDTGNGLVRMEHDGPVYQGTYIADGGRIIFCFTPVNWGSPSRAS